jgi:hypothetical protein
MVERRSGGKIALHSELTAALPAKFIRLWRFVAACFTGLLHRYTSFQSLMLD